MKILYVHLYDPKFGMGGAERLALDLACAVKARGGHEVVLAVNASELAEAARGRDIPCEEIYWSKAAAFKTRAALEALRRSFRPEIAHSHHRFSTFLLDVFFKRRFVIIHTEHVLRRDKRLLFRYGDFATAVADSVRANLVDHYRVPAARTATIPNATPARRVDPVRLAEIRKTYCGAGGAVLSCVGRLEEQKGHRYLIEAVSLIPPSSRNRIRVFLLGAGSREAELRRQAKECGVQDCFLFLGHCEDVAEFVAASDFMVLPSLWEGMPLSVLEAFSLGKTVIATHIPGTRDLVEAGKTGYLVPARDPRSLSVAIGRLLAQPEQIRMLGAAAYQAWESRYSFDRMVDGYLAFYQKAVSPHAVP